MSLVVIDREDLKAMIDESVKNGLTDLNKQMALMNSRLTDDVLYSPKEVKERFGASLFMQAKWRSKGLIPFIKIGVKKIFYRKTALDEFFEARGNLKLNRL